MPYFPKPDNDSFIERLAEQAALARVLGQQRLQQMRERNSAQVNPHIQSAGFDAENSCEIVQAADGSIILGKSLTNGARATGDALLLHQGEGRVTIDAPSAVRRISAKKKVLVPAAPYPFKILFLLVENGRALFYIGGDRAQPTLCLVIPIIYINNCFLNNVGKTKTNFVAGAKYYVDPYFNIVTFYSDEKKNWTIAGGTGAEHLDWVGNGFWRSGLVAPVRLDYGAEQITHSGSTFVDPRFVNPLRQYYHGGYPSSLSPGPLVTYAPDSSSNPNQFIIPGIIEATHAHGTEQRNKPAILTSNNMLPATGMGISISREYREEGYTSLPGSINIQLPQCTKDNVGQSASYIYYWPLLYSIKTKEASTEEALPLMSFSTLDKHLITKNGTHSHKINSKERTEFRETSKQSSFGYVCSAYAQGTIYETVHYEWNGPGNNIYEICRYNFTASYFKETKTAYTETLDQKCEIAILEGVYLPYEKHELTVSSSSSKYEAINFARPPSTAGPDITPFETTGTSNITTFQSLPTGLIVSDKGNLGIYKIESENSSQSSDAKSSGYWVPYSDGENIGAPITPLSIAISNKSSMASSSYYLYDKKSGSTFEINSAANIYFSLNRRLNVEVGTFTFECYTESRWFYQDVDKFITNTKNTTTSTDLISSNAGPIDSSFTQNSYSGQEYYRTIIDPGHLTRTDTHINNRYSADTRYTTTTTTITETTTIPNPIWSILKGTSIILTQTIVAFEDRGKNKDDDSAILGFGTIIDYTFEDVKINNNDYDDLPKNRRVNSLVVKIDKVITVPYDYYAYDEAVIYSNNDSILAVRLDGSANFVENSTANSSVVGTIYSTQKSFDPRTKDSVGYVVAYDIIQVNGNSKLQVVRRHDEIIGVIKTIKNSSADIKATSYF